MWRSSEGRGEWTAGIRSFFGLCIWGTGRWSVGDGGFDFPCREMVSKTTSYETVSVIGQRREMEDAVRAEQGFWSGRGGGESYDFYGVYDGHGGARVAKVCRERLYRVLAEEIEI